MNKEDHRWLEERDRRYSERFEAQEVAMSAALAAAEKAVSKAEAATHERFASVNEFRGQLTDQAATFISRIEFDTKLGAVNEKLSNLGPRLVAYLVAAVTVTTSVLYVLLR